MDRRRFTKWSIFVSFASWFIYRNQETCFAEIEHASSVLLIENGNKNIVKSCQMNEHDVYQGMCIVAVKSTGGAGKITLIATSGNLLKGSL
jgi:hypothetical protein